VKGGQAIFIRTPEDKRILINGGSNSEIIRRVSSLLPFYSRRIDTLIATDTQGKNVTGLIDMTRRYQVDHARIPGVTLTSLGLASTSDPIHKSFLATLKEHKVSIQEVFAGDTFLLDSVVKAHVLFPVSSEEFSYSKASGPEVVINVSYGSTAFLFTGSVSKKVQKYIATSTLLERSQAHQVLIVSKSGSPDDLSSEFLEKLSPEYFIFSKNVSTSPSKAPSQKTSEQPLDRIDRESRLNIQDTGTIKLTSDGETVTVSHER